MGRGARWGFGMRVGVMGAANAASGEVADEVADEVARLCGACAVRWQDGS